MDILNSARNARNWKIISEIFYIHVKNLIEIKTVIQQSTDSKHYEFIYK